MKYILRCFDSCLKAENFINEYSEKGYKVDKLVADIELVTILMVKIND